MKKVFFLALGLFIALSVNAQVKVVSPHPDVKVKFLRCIESGGTAVIEFTVNNLSNQDQEFTILGYNNYSTAYDDEGNEMYIGEEIFRFQIRPIMQSVSYFPAIFLSNAESI